MCDNDDFLLPSGIEKCISFLDKHSDYVSAGGAVPGFSVKGKVPLTGEIINISPRYGPNYAGPDVSESTTLERAQHQMERYRTVYYDVQRADAARRIFSEVVDLNPIGFGLHEIYCAVRLATLGKSKFDNYATYLRQRGTSAGNGDHGDLIEHITSPEFMPSFNRVMDGLGQAVSPDGSASGMLRREFIKGVKIWLARQERPNIFSRALARVPKRREEVPTIPELVSIRRVVQDGSYLQRLIGQ